MDRTAGTDRPTAAPAPRVDVVFGPDDRRRVPDTTVAPFRSIGQITAEFPNGARYTGTGTLIDEYHVLTAAHVLFSAGDGGQATQVEFAPARNGGIYPYPPVGFARLHVPEEYRRAALPIPGAVVQDYTEYLYDFGVVTLRAPVTFDSYPEPYWASDAELRGVTCSVTGYPGDKPAGTMWGAEGLVQTEPSEQFLFYRISTSGGQSGAAVMAQLPRFPVPAIVGVHVAGSTREGLLTNFAVRLNPAVLDVITSWL